VVNLKGHEKIHDRIVRSFSGGQQARLLLASALIQDALAIAFAFDLAFEESFLGFAFGLGLSQTCFFVAILLAVPLS
jgi:hypothetical protein